MLIPQFVVTLTWFGTSPCQANGDLRDATFDEVALAGVDAGDYLYESWVNGPVRGMTNSHSWPGIALEGCELPSASSTMCGCIDGWPIEIGNNLQVCRKDDGSGNWRCAPGWARVRGPPYCRKDSDDACEIVGPESHVPCGPLPERNLNRVISFHSGAYDMVWDLGAMAPVSLSASGSAVLSVSGGLQVASQACTGPADANIEPGGYPMRLVRAGRYMAHYWIGALSCGASSATLEVFAWPDCFEFRLVAGDGSDSAVDLTLGDFQGSAAGVGSASLIVCAQEDGSFTSFNPQAQDHLEISASDSTAATVEVDGAGWLLTLPNQNNRGVLTNDEWNVVVANSAEVSTPVRLHFYVGFPRGITGIAAVVRNSTDDSPSGIHAQLSKNWHRDQDNDVPHEGSWLSVLMVLRMPPRSRLSFELLLAYQFAGDLHSVSHSQLSLIGWGSNGHWDEVGLGSAGEAITYEPDGQQRRTMVDDVRPFLVCGMNSAAGECDGNYATTGWTENIGGAEFLGAFDSAGSYQYLTGVTSHYVTNGPRLTNVTYGGVTADGAISVARSVSTWTADDFARHLHSFRYDVLETVTYGRLILYQLGADNYNEVGYPGFAHGDSSGLRGERASTNDIALNSYSEDFRHASCGEPPCWFFLSSSGKIAHRGLVVRKWRARLGGVDRPVEEGPAFSLVGTARSGVGLEFSLPADIQELQPGDFVEADLEILIFPTSSGVYYGPSLRLTSWLDSFAGQPWQFVAREASSGDLDIEMGRGMLERAFPLRVRADSAGHAAFSVRLPSGWPGVLPITISGLSSSRAGTLWQKESDGSWAEVTSAGLFQVDLEGDAGYAFTFSMPLSEMDELAVHMGASDEACDTSSVSEAQCLRAVQALLPHDQVQGRTTLVAGRWQHVPPGCSVQSGGDWAAHYNRRSSGSGAAYRVVCNGNTDGSANEDSEAEDDLLVEFAFSDGPPQHQCVAPVVINVASAGSCSQGATIAIGSNTCTPLCAEGYTANESALSCAFGLLSPPSFICEPNRCDAPAGESCLEGASVASGESCTPQCLDGFNPNETSLSCFAGTLTPEVFSCEHNSTIRDFSGIDGLVSSAKQVCVPQVLFFFAATLSILLSS